MSIFHKTFSALITPRGGASSKAESFFLSLLCILRLSIGARDDSLFLLKYTE